MSTMAANTWSAGRLLWGDEPKVPSLVLATVVGVLVTAGWFGSHSLRPSWQTLLAATLVFDLAAGVVVNLTSSTNDFYRRRPALRWAFIAVHVQPIAIGWLIGEPLGPSALAWAIAVTGAAVVNGLRGDRVLGGALVVAGVALLDCLPLGSAMLEASSLFLIKLTYAFAVDHSRGEPIR